MRSCGKCEFCDEAAENCCAGFEGLYDPKFGGYATSITVCECVGVAGMSGKASAICITLRCGQVPERFAFPIPDGIPLELCGPLLCAGVTTCACAAAVGS